MEMRFPITNRKFIRLSTIFRASFKRIIIVLLLLATLFLSWSLLTWLEDVINQNVYHHHYNRTLWNYSATPIPMPLRFLGKALPFHRVYEPRPIATYRKRIQISEPLNSTKIILLWTPWNGVRKTINYYSLRPGTKSFVRYECPVSDCVAVHDRSQITNADVVFFHLLDLNIHDLPKYRRSDQVWILYNMEPPWLVARKGYNLTAVNGLFNFSMSYRNDSDILVNYGFIDRVDIARNDNWNFDTVWTQKTRSAIWISSDCNTDGGRENYVKALRKYIDVDVYGTCGDMKCLPSQSAACYDILLVRYKFYLSFENAICKDYVTEKFFNVFNYDIVPVVFGGADYSKFVPDGSFISANEFPKPRDLALELMRIGSNASLYGNFLSRKLYYKAFLDPWTCRLCERLNLPPQFSRIADIRKWWITDAECRQWDETNQTIVRIKN